MRYPKLCNLACTGSCTLLGVMWHAQAVVPCWGLLHMWHGEAQCAVAAVQGYAVVSKLQQALGAIVVGYGWAPGCELLEHAPLDEYLVSAACTSLGLSHVGTCSLLGSLRSGMWLPGCSAKEAPSLPFAHLAGGTQPRHRIPPAPPCSSTAAPQLCRNRRHQVPTQCRAAW